MPANTRQVLIVQTTLPSAAAARRMAARIVAQKAGACVQSSSICSTYRWRGKTVSAREWMLTVKTRKGRLGKLVALLRLWHPYELPEIVVVPVGCTPEYAAWVREETP